MVHVLQGIHTEGDEAAAQDAPQQAQAPAGQPGEGTRVVGQLSHNHLVAGRTAHLDGAVKKGHGWLHEDGLYCAGVGIEDGHWLGVIQRRVRAFPIRACHEPRGRSRHWGWHPSKNYRGCKERAEKYNPQPRTETHTLQSADKKIKNYTYIPYIQNHKER